MSTEFRVSTNTLGDVARLLQSAVALFDTRLADTNGVVASIAGGSWQGEDADLFTENYRAWEGNAMALRLVLDNLSHTLLAAERTYEATESGLDSGFDSVTAGMSGPSASKAQQTSNDKSAEFVSAEPIAMQSTGATP
ncbi:hypothetical protein EYE40_15240 [Glaciihabitans arcticus]|uniref:WXG100 family type VII secretion target n=1 Tax=Glaciihabitans arcticus TaxID=2668039 RepID=A0A4Q9GPM7_9MICO|nr:WXG100 family type VII secretion target [Glaciihabitans arcticus]TBN55551.1 hypothetical protein EYE40_15240 [Glaciihabitans arcticus]